MLATLLGLGCNRAGEPLGKVDEHGVAELDAVTAFCINGESAHPIARQICALYPEGGLENLAIHHLKALIEFLEAGDLEGARRKVFQLVDLTVENLDVLVDPNGTEPPTRIEAVARLTRALYNRVGLNLPLDPEDLELAAERGIVGVVGPQGGTHVAKNGKFGVRFAPGSVDENVLVVGTPLPDDSDPLRTPRQFPAFFDLETFPPTTFEPAVTVGMCARAPAELIDQVVIGHNVGATGFEILPPGPPILDCGPAGETPEAPGPSGGSSAPALAGGRDATANGLVLLATVRRSVGGQASGFSAFGGAIAGEPGTGSIVGHVVDATTGQGLVGASVSAFCPPSVSEPTATTLTDSNGGFGFEALPVGSCRLEASRAGFVSVEQTVTVTSGEPVNVGVLALAPITTGQQVTIVLTWDSTPRDLDAHLTGPASEGRFHVFFGNTGSCEEPPFAALDVDDQSGFGPETITICRQGSGTYRFSVHDFTNRFNPESSELANSGAQVAVFTGASQIGSFSVPQEPGNLWRVFELQGETLVALEEMTVEDDPGSIGAPLPAGAAPVDLRGKTNAAATKGSIR